MVAAPFPKSMRRRHRKTYRNKPHSIFTSEPLRLDVVISLVIILSRMCYAYDDDIMSYMFISKTYTY